MAIQWNEPKEEKNTDTGISWQTNTLAHSQSLVDRIRQAQQAEQQAQQAASPMNIAGQTVLGMGKDFINSTLKGVGSAIKAPVDIAKQAFGGMPDETANIPGIGGMQKSIQGEFSSETIPQVMSGQVSPFGATAGAVGQTVGAAANVVGGAQLVGGLAKKGVFSGAGKAITEYLTKRADTKATEALTQSIMPKLNKKEVQLALREGRIQPGRDPSILRGGTPDQVMPSESTQQSIGTIKQYIPNAGKLKAPELHKQIGDQVKNMGASLRPVMDTTPITPKTVGKITKDWEALKAKQLADPYAPATANVEKLQADFENNFLKKSKSGNFGDLWDTRIAYDASVPANVKNATSLSSDALQTQKEIWLQNREILNGAINDSKTGLGEVSSKTFEEMNNLYNAQRGIESSYKPSAEGPISKIKQFAKDHPFITGAGLLGANKVSKETTGISVPTPF